MNTVVEQVLVVRKVKAASIYKLLFCGLLCSLIPLGVLFGISGFFGADTVKWNNQPIHGAAALFAGPVLSVFVALFFTGFLGTLTCLGLWLLSRFRTLSIRVVMAQQAAQTDSPASSGSAA
jgi:dolichyl-phosphate-mannose--protein O-mannosyl transferase